MPCHFAAAFKTKYVILGVFDPALWALQNNTSRYVDKKVVAPVNRKDIGCGPPGGSAINCKSVAFYALAIQIIWVFDL
jgi:hypothetical protein